MSQPQQQEQPQTQHDQYDYNNLIDRIDAIERKLDLILQKLDGSVIKNCDKMGIHIDFVNGVYDTVKVPLNYISKKIYGLTHPTSLHLHKELPSLLTDTENPKIQKNEWITRSALSIFLWIKKKIDLKDWP